MGQRSDTSRHSRTHVNKVPPDADGQIHAPTHPTRVIRLASVVFLKQVRFSPSVSQEPRNKYILPVHLQLPTVMRAPNSLQRMSATKTRAKGQSTPTSTTAVSYRIRTPAKPPRAKAKSHAASQSLSSPDSRMRMFSNSRRAISGIRKFNFNRPR